MTSDTPADGYRPTVTVVCECGFDGCDGYLPRVIDDLRPDDILADKESRARVAAARASADRGHTLDELTESSMPIRLMDGPLNWGYHRSLPAHCDSFAGVILRVPLPGRDPWNSRLDRCEHAVYVCVSDAPVRRAWRFHFVGYELSDADRALLAETADHDLEER